MGVSADAIRKSGVKVNAKEQGAYDLADEYRASVLRRTGLKREELACPREKSDMTPCIARDGGLAVCDPDVTPKCVGCLWRLTRLVADEEAVTLNEAGKRDDGL